MKIEVNLLVDFLCLAEYHYSFVSHTELMWVVYWAKSPKQNTMLKMELQNNDNEKKNNTLKLDPKTILWLIFYTAQRTDLSCSFFFQGEKCQGEMNTGLLPGWMGPVWLNVGHSTVNCNHSRKKPTANNL